MKDDKKRLLNDGARKVAEESVAKKPRLDSASPELQKLGPAECPQVEVPAFSRKRLLNDGSQEVAEQLIAKKPRQGVPPKLQKLGPLEDPQGKRLFNYSVDRMGVAKIHEEHCLS